MIYLLYKPTKTIIPSTCSEINNESVKPKTGGESK